MSADDIAAELETVARSVRQGKYDRLDGQGIKRDWLEQDLSEALDHIFDYERQPI